LKSGPAERWAQRRIPSAYRAQNAESVGYYNVGITHCGLLIFNQLSPPMPHSAHPLLHPRISVYTSASPSLHSSLPSPSTSTIPVHLRRCCQTGDGLWGNPDSSRLYSSNTITSALAPNITAASHAACILPVSACSSMYQCAANAPSLEVDHFAARPAVINALRTRNSIACFLATPSRARGLLASSIQLSGVGHYQPVAKG
jgi:hypothetical protein